MLKELVSAFDSIRAKITERVSTIESKRKRESNLVEPRDFYQKIVSAPPVKELMRKLAGE